ncbi:MAG: hypothetical protein Q9184_005492, partial [Pyrenodesmia sp. 2 TL-2023]
REVRRKKPPESRQTKTLKPSSSASSSKATAETSEQDQGQAQAQGQGQGLERSSVGFDSGQPGRKRPHTADASVGIRDLEARPNQSQQQMKQGLSSYSVGDGSSSGSVLDGLDEWLGTESFLDQIMTTPLENFDSSVDMLDETMEDSLSGDADSLTGFDDIGPGIVPSTFPNAVNLAQPLMPSHDVVSPLGSTIPPTRSQPAASGPNSNYKGHESLFQTSTSGRRSGRTPTILNNVQSIPGPSNPPYPSPTSALHTESPAQSPLLPGLTSQGDAKEGCPCLYLTACLLEELGAESARSEPATLDMLLGSLRWALVRCTSILECERCTSLSDNNMLLAMVGQYMSFICERIVMCYIELQRAQDQRQARQQPSTSALLGDGKSVSGYLKDEDGGTMSQSGLVNTDDDIWFSTYRIDNGSERMQVLQCLARVQLTEFSQLLEKLQARAGSRRGHLVLLTEAQKRIKAVRLMLRAKLNRSPGERT